MCDSTLMTVEFLRARLLSERSVSRTARQRSDELAKRVAELEEQLRILTVQRKKAEKAAAQVLSILEAKGLSDLSEVVDSSSEQDVIPSSLKGSSDTKENESSTTTRIDRSEDDEYSGTEPSLSPSSQTGNLCWKGNENNQDSTEKKKFKQSTQRQRRTERSNYEFSVNSFKRHPLGKSCRKNKRKETGSSKDGKLNSHLNDFRKPEASPNAGDKVTPNCVRNSDASSGKNEDYDLLTFSFNEKNNCPQENGFSKHEQMEQALVKQAQLIFLFQDQEKSQREWEEKFNENNCIKMEPIEESKTERTCNDNKLKEDDATKLDMDGVIATEIHLGDLTADPVFDSLASKNTDSNEGLEALTFSKRVSVSDEGVHSSQHAIQVDGDGLINHSQNNFKKQIPLKSNLQDFEFDQSMYCSGEKEKVQYLRDDNSIVSHGSSLPLNNLSTESPSRECISSVQSSSIYSRKHSQPGKEVHTPLHDPRASGKDVLENLQRAKMTLKQELNKYALPNQSIWSSSSGSGGWNGKPDNMLDTSFNSTNLFRLPTDPLPGLPPTILSGRPTTRYNFSSNLDYPLYSDNIHTSSSRQAFDHYHGVPTRITPRFNDFGPRIGPVYTSMFSFPSPDSQTVHVTEDNNHKKNGDEDFAGSLKSLRSSLDVERTYPHQQRN